MKTKFFYDTYRGEDYYIYTLENEHLTVGITDFGAAIQFIKVGGVDIALGFNSIEERVASGTFAGGTIGRVGNRIKAGDFTLTAGNIMSHVMREATIFTAVSRGLIKSCLTSAEGRRTA